MFFKRHLMVVAGLLLLNACATIYPPASTQSITPIAIHQQHLAKLSQITGFELKGRLGVVTQKQGFSGGIDWQHAISDDNVDIYSPIGGKIANISKNASGVILTKQDGQKVYAQDTEDLIETTLGFKLPLTGLSDWAIGRPTASDIINRTWDENGRLLTLKQEGWDISYENYAENNGVFLPNKVILKSEKVNLKLLIEKWIAVSK